MCGIAGWGRSAPGADVTLRLERMCVIQQHRGPDDSGLYTSPDGKVGLGHRRLSILDLSERGRQPMGDKDGIDSTVWISYNGEIYNFKELRRELQATGHAFRTGTDTEVILRAYNQWGTDCLARLNGMFAFAIYDARAQRLILARDRFGIKPLYYAWDGATLFFASEIKSILESGIRARFQQEHVAELFLFTGLSGERTLFEGVRSLRPGTFLALSLQDGSHVVRPYYVQRSRVDVSRYADASGRSEADGIRVLRGLLMESVERHLVSDVPVGTFCSGGVDSGVITAMARTVSDDVSLFNVSSKGYGDMDEVAFARKVARHVGARLIVYEVDRLDLQRGLIDATYYHDNPLSIVNAVPMLYISKLARDHGVKVLLSGEGGDELFGGYDWRHLSLLRGLTWQHRLAFIPRLWRKIFAGTGMGNEVLYHHRFKTREINMDNTLELVSGGFERAEERRRDVEAYGFVSDRASREVLGALLSDLREYLEPLLMRQDRMTMAASIECRLPLLDYTVVEYALNIPLRLKIRNNIGKWVLKRVAEEFLPRDVVYRPKKAFPIPAAMLYDHLNPAIFADGFWENYFSIPAQRCRQMIEESDSRSLLWYQLLMMEVWGRIFLNHENPEAIYERAFL